MTIVFYSSCVIAVVSALMVITRLNAVHALLYLIVSFLALGVVMFALGAPFAAALEIIIYAGAIMVLFIFVIMLFNLGAASIHQERQWLTPRMWIGPVVLSVALIGEFVYLLLIPIDASLAAPQAAALAPKDVAYSLYSTYMLGVELASFLLLAGLVGAYYLGRQQDPDVKNGGAQ
jgi:NADH-quinone oxidoreductase subunit J